MPLLVAAATPKELAAALRNAPELGEAPSDAGSILRRPLHGRDILLMVTGVGPINAALAAGKALAPPRDIEGVLLVGVAGTFDVERAPIGSLTAATSEAFPEFGLRTPEGVNPRGIGFSQGDAGSGGEVWDELPLDPHGAASRMGMDLPGCIAGPAVTVAGVTNCERILADFAARYAPLTENMEGFPWALATARAGVPFLELRSISNMVGNRTGWNLQAALDSLAGAVPELIRPGRTLAKGR
ncbi:futalosine hydrolase [Oceanidesulfovibrio indonesiensis]|uniref:Futalosine hydrolase n=1 Tax=Oceanidesulfovibrio indonesiensis TaxID=54767 RepID=A0A7M3MG16_9BACT|nr:futalosine hydrolase [Oceanidesulfovibrio indonesiensis]TVM17991.1 futalosine hydrolase [Oceanidesulfovibrio indonesiensis]